MKNLYTSINLTEEEKKVAEELFSEDDPFIVLAKIYENNLKASKSKILSFYMNRSDAMIDLMKKTIAREENTRCYVSRPGVRINLTKDDKFNNSIGVLSVPKCFHDRVLCFVRNVFMINESSMEIRNLVFDPMDTKDQYNFAGCMRLQIKYKHEKDFESKFKELNPYSGLEIFEKNFDAVEMIAYASLYKRYPYVELLAKAGYKKIIEDWVRKIITGKRDDKFNILFKPGNNIKTIIQLPKFIYDDLKEEGDINIWDNTRKLNKKYNFTNESYQKFKDFNLPFGSSSVLQRVLKLKFDGKPLYTLNSLMSYLSRIDMYQAIAPAEALQILLDYLTMSIEMNVMPDINSNSLKREHDVTVRNYNLVAQAIETEKFRKVVEKMKQFEYADEKYCIIAPSCEQDLINEGRNNRNCVGSYIKHVAKGRDMIFFMRKKTEPDKSMITIELSPNGKEIWQKYETANRKIEDTDKLEFIEKWMDWIRKGRKEA